METYHDNDYRLHVCSWCVDQGNPVSDGSVIPTDEFDINDDQDTGEPTPDIERQDRVQDSPDSDHQLQVDMGYDEMASSEMAPNGNCPWDCEEVPDGTVDVGDFLKLLAEWGRACTEEDVRCDLVWPPAVDVSDFLALLAAWGPCPEGGDEIPKTVADCIEKFGMEDPLILEKCICAVTGVAPEECGE